MLSNDVRYERNYNVIGQINTERGRYDSFSLTVNLIFMMATREWGWGGGGMCNIKHPHDALSFDY